MKTHSGQLQSQFGYGYKRSSVGTFCKKIRYTEFTAKSMYILLIFINCVLHMLYISKNCNQHIVCLCVV